MESKQNLEVIQEAINQLLEEEQTYDDDLLSTEGEEYGNSVGRHRHRRSLLFELRSQLESLEEENREPVESKQEEETTSPSPTRIDEILKELKNIKRQNLMTHCLVSAMIVVTLTWQLSEVSLILKIKHVLTSPLVSLGGIVKGFLNGQPKEQVMKHSIPVLKVPQLELDTSEEE